MPIKTIADFTDKQLADMVRNGCYMKSTCFGTGQTDSRFLLVLAVPYGPDEDVTTLRGALNGFAELVAGECAFVREETNFQVYDHATDQFSEVSLETLPALLSCSECGEPMTIDDHGIANHVGVDGNIDHDTDADHVAIADLVDA